MRECFHGTGIRQQTHLHSLRRGRVCPWSEHMIRRKPPQCLANTQVSGLVRELLRLIDSLRHHDARLDLADIACAMRLSRGDCADLRGEPRCSRSTPVGVPGTCRHELTPDLPEVDRCTGGATPQHGRWPTGRLLAARLQVLHATAHPAGPQRPPTALGQHLARPRWSRSGEGSQRRQRDGADRRRGGSAAHQPRSRMGTRTTPPFHVIGTQPRVGWPGGSHPRVPTERSVTVSRHSALLIKPTRTRGPRVSRLPTRSAGNWETHGKSIMQTPATCCMKMQRTTRTGMPRRRAGDGHPADLPHPSAAVSSSGSTPSCYSR